MKIQRELALPSKERTFTYTEEAYESCRYEAISSKLRSWWVGSGVAVSRKRRKYLCVYLGRVTEAENSVSEATCAPLLIPSRIKKGIFSFAPRFSDIWLEMWLRPVLKIITAYFWVPAAFFVVREAVSYV